MDNILLTVVCSAASFLAGLIAWRGRKLRVVPARRLPGGSARDAALVAFRQVACVFAAATVAGSLVVGLGGRLVMRVVAAASGGDAQGRLTEAEELVGEITLGGTVAFVLFVGMLLPVATSLLFIPLRHLVPNTAWIAGLWFGTLLLATVGVADPLSADNVDFVILSPVWLAVILVAATALLYGMTFCALVARFQTSLPDVARRNDAPPTRWSRKAPYLALGWLIVPPLLAATAVYTAGRAVFRGRVAMVLLLPQIRTALIVVGGVVSFAALARVAVTVVQIV